MPSKIEWLQNPDGSQGETWNPVSGCSKVSQGCKHCYAETIAHRFWGERKFTDVLTHSDRLDKPLHWRKPRMVFVNSMSDLFHEAVPFEFVAAVFGVMAACPQHTFIVLTKRPARMLEWSEWVNRHVEISTDRDTGERIESHVSTDGCDERSVAVGDAMLQALGWRQGLFAQAYDQPWPLPNVWGIVSVEDQATCDERILPLLSSPFAVRGVSYEPALGPVDFGGVWMEDGYSLGRSLFNHGEGAGLDWIVVGGEYGPKARPCDVDWIRSTVEQCAAAGVPCFVKQVGSYPLQWTAEDWTPENGGSQTTWALKHPKGGDPSEWPVDLRVRQFPPALVGTP